MAKQNERQMARKLFARGVSQDRIATIVGRAESTISRWKSEADGSWEAARSEAESYSVDELLRNLERSLAEVLSDDDVNPSSKADSVAKLTRAINVLEKRYRSIDVRLQVCHDIARWAQANLKSDDEWTVLRKVIDRFTSDILEEEAHANGR